LQWFSHLNVTVFLTVPYAPAELKDEIEGQLNDQNTETGFWCD
jgi:hypothetical protein